MFKRRYRLIAPGLALGLALFGMSACSSSKKGATTSSTNAPTGSSGSSSSAPAPTGTPFVVGFECSCSGAFASSTAIQEPIIKAWAAYTNANGGINGHPVQLVFQDDALNPGTSLSQVTAMVEQNHVIAIIDGTDVDSAWTTFVSQHNVPVIGDNLANASMFTNPNFFPEGQTINTLAPSIAAAAKKAGIKSLGLVYCSADPICAQLAKPMQQAAVAVGIKAPFASAVPESAPNYTAPCLAAKNAGVDGIFAAESSTVVESFVKSCATQGYTPKYLAEDGAVSKAFLNDSALQGMLAVENNLPAEITSNAAIQTMTAALDKYSPGTTSNPNYGPGATGVWASGMLFAAAAKAANLGDNATSAQLIQGLYSLHGEILGGLAPPLTYTQGKPTTVNCWFYLGIQNHQFTAPYGTAPACGSSAS